MADEEKKTSEDVTEEEQHDSAPQPEPEPDEDEQDQDECDEAIAGLLATVDALDVRVAELERQLTQHGIEFEHTRRAEAGPGDEHGPAPEERHLYFRRIGKR